MKLCRFEHNGTTYFGSIKDESVVVTTSDFTILGPEYSLSEVRLLPPVEPTKIVCVGRNYADHAAELGNEVPKQPLLFLKAPSAIIGPFDTIAIPDQSSQVEHEGELAIVIGRDCKNIPDDVEAAQYIRGYTCLNDVTARDVQRADVQFSRGKSFDTFCPIGPYIVPGLDPRDLAVTVTVNGEVRQSGRTSQMIFPCDFLLRYISRQMTLKAGDIIATGTPAGVSRMNSGDVCEVTIEGIGSLQNKVF